MTKHNTKYQWPQITLGEKKDRNVHKDKNHEKKQTNKKKSPNTKKTPKQM